MEKGGKGCRGSTGGGRGGTRSCVCARSQLGLSPAALTHRLQIPPAVFPALAGAVLSLRAADSCLWAGGRNANPPPPGAVFPSGPPPPGTARGTLGCWDPWGLAPGGGTMAASLGSPNCGQPSLSWGGGGPAFQLQIIAFARRVLKRNEKKISSFRELEQLGKSMATIRKRSRGGFRALLRPLREPKHWVQTGENPLKVPLLITKPGGAEPLEKEKNK